MKIRPNMQRLLCIPEQMGNVVDFGVNAETAMLRAETESGIPMISSLDPDRALVAILSGDRALAVELYPELFHRTPLDG